MADQKSKFEWEESDIEILPPEKEDEEEVENAFCATGQGGGVDPSCGKEGADAAAQEGGSGKSKQHDVKLPKNPKRLTIDQANAALKQLGYSQVDQSHDRETGKSFVELKHLKSGKRVTMEVSKLRKVIYQAQAKKSDGELQPPSKKEGSKIAALRGKVAKQTEKVAKMAESLSAKKQAIADKYDAQRAASKERMRQKLREAGIENTKKMGKKK
jgi:hypothetical protein